MDDPACARSHTPFGADGSPESDSIRLERGGKPNLRASCRVGRRYPSQPVVALRFRLRSAEAMMRASHGSTHAAVSRGMISRAMVSICCVSYLYGTKMIFCVPTARWALSCSTHSSTVPMIALSLVDSLQAAKSHSLVSHSII